MPGFRATDINRRTTLDLDERKKVLLVDDDEAVVTYLVTKLAKNYRLASTTQPRSVVELAKRERPDVILCDIDMPDFSGGDVAAALAEDPLTRGIPFIYLTSLVSPEEASEMGGYVGGRRGIAKRAPLGELLKQIEEATR